MGNVSAIPAPLHRFLARFSNTGNAGFPLNAAPSLDFLGSGLQDHRLPYNARGSSAVQPGIVGFIGGIYPTVNLVPATAAVNNIAAAANPTNGTAMTLVAASGAGVIVPTVAAPATFQPNGVVLTSGVVIDALPTTVNFGAGGNFLTSFYNRSNNIARCVSVTGVANGSGGVVLVKGLDAYGFAMSQAITLGAGVNTVNSTKAFKAITSVTPQFTDTHAISVGVADIFGLPLYCNLAPDIEIVWNGTLVTAVNTGFVAGDTTTPATTTTGDVRGTYAVQSASDGTKRLTIRQSLVLTAVAANPTTGLFGQPQV